MKPSFSICQDNCLEIIIKRIHKSLRHHTLKPTGFRHRNSLVFARTLFMLDKYQMNLFRRYLFFGYPSSKTRYKVIAVGFNKHIHIFLQT